MSINDFKHDTGPIKISFIQKVITSKKTKKVLGFIWESDDIYRQSPIFFITN